MSLPIRSPRRRTGGTFVFARILGKIRLPQQENCLRTAARKSSLPIALPTICEITSNHEF
jgi:hypothetical protein